MCDKELPMDLMIMSDLFDHKVAVNGTGFQEFEEVLPSVMFLIVNAMLRETDPNVMQNGKISMKTEDLSDSWLSSRASDTDSLKARLSNVSWKVTMFRSRTHSSLIRSIWTSVW